MGTDLIASGPPDEATVARLMRDVRLSTLCEGIESDPQNVRLPADIAAALPSIIEIKRAELAPADDAEIMGKLIEICAGLGLGASQQEKTQWQAWACIQLTKLPRGLCLEGLSEASTTCDNLKQVVKAVFAYCESYPANMRRQLSRLERLAALPSPGGQD